MPFPDASRRLIADPTDAARIGARIGAGGRIGAVGSFGGGIGATATIGAIAAVAIVAAVCVAAGHVVPDLVGWLVTRRADLLDLQTANPLGFLAATFALMTAMCALALPGCGVVALAAGVFHGFVGGTVVVLLASTLGATLSFLAARHLWRDAAQRRFGGRLAAVESGLARDGALVVFSLRVAPVIPFGLLNPLLGLTAMPVRQFVVASLFGMLAGSAVFVYAGTTLAAARGVGDLFPPGLVAAMAALALLPWVVRAAWRRAR